MVEYGKSILEQYHFTDGNLHQFKGGYPIKNILEEEQDKKYLIGGGLVESIGIDKFNDYAIPIGLLSFQDNSFERNQLRTKCNGKREPECISDELFDKLFSSVTKVRKHNNKTKKHSLSVGGKTASKRGTPLT